MMGLPWWAILAAIALGFILLLGWSLGAIASRADAMSERDEEAHKKADRARSNGIGRP